jgi:hypothetical protein
MLQRSVEKLLGSLPKILLHAQLLTLETSSTSDSRCNAMKSSSEDGRILTKLDNARQ